MKKKTLSYMGIASISVYIVLNEELFVKHIISAYVQTSFLGK